MAVNKAECRLDFKTIHHGQRDRVRFVLACIGSLKHWTAVRTVARFNGPRLCPLLDQSGQSRILARDGMSAYDP